MVHEQFQIDIRIANPRDKGTNALQHHFVWHIGDESGKLECEKFCVLLRQVFVSHGWKIYKSNRPKISVIRLRKKG